jgi:hypothetical protein
VDVHDVATDVDDPVLRDPRGGVDPGLATEVESHRLIRDFDHEQRTFRVSIAWFVRLSNRSHTATSSSAGCGPSYDDPRALTSR